MSEYLIIGIVVFVLIMVLIFTKDKKK